MPNSCDTLLRAGTLVTQDKDRTVLSDAAVAVTGGVITAVGPWDGLSGIAASETIDLSRDIVLPGLVNAHTHAAMTVFRGMKDDLPLMEWLTGHIWPAESRLTPEIVATGTALACAEMLASGTTTFFDQYILEHSVASAVHRTGMRAVLGEGVFDTPNASYGDQRAAFEKVEALAESLANKPLLTPAMVAHSVYATDHKSLVRLGRMARERGLTFSLHVSETPAETAMCLDRFGKRPVDILDGLGILDRSLLIAHAVDVTGPEIALLAERGVNVAHNPRSNMKLASGMAPVQAMREAGVRVCLGTDGAASNNALNMFAEMAAAGLMAKVRGMDPTALPAQALLDMATVEGARSLGHSGIGSIEPGMQADIIALDGDAPNLQPRHAPVSLMAYSATGREVKLAMVAGRTLYRDGAFLTLDYPALLEEMESIRKWVRGS
ncbi:MAG: amidohydrolase family protein [Thermodesulfobacteriota bacterium]